MEQTATVTKKKTLESSAWTLVFHNDDYTTMDFVVFVLVDICHLTLEQAEAIMLEVHDKGHAHVGRYTRDIANTKQYTIIQASEKNNHPLRVTVREL